MITDYRWVSAQQKPSIFYLMCLVFCKHKCIFQRLNERLSVYTGQKALQNNNTAVFSPPTPPSFYYHALMSHEAIFPRHASSNITQCMFKRNFNLRIQSGVCFSADLHLPHSWRRRRQSHLLVWMRITTTAVEGQMTVNSQSRSLITTDHSEEEEGGGGGGMGGMLL